MGSGRRLKQARLEAGLTAAELVRRSGIGSSEVSLWETGKREVPRTVRVRERLARAFEKDEVQLGAYLDGKLPLKELYPPSTSLNRAIAAGDGEGYNSLPWSPATRELARSLESELPKEQWPAVWIRRLDVIEKRLRRLRARLKAQWAEDVRKEGTES